VTGVAVYDGQFGVAQAERLLWRAGFGPRKGEAEALAQLGLERAVRSLTRPAAEKLVGPAPTDEKGRPLAPYDAWGHDHVWNDGVGSQRLMLQQNELFRTCSHANHAALGMVATLRVR